MAQTKQITFKEAYLKLKKLELKNKLRQQKFRKKQKENTCSDQKKNKLTYKPS